MNTRKITIVGAGGFGKEVLWLIRECNEYATEKTGQPLYTIAGFVTNEAAEKDGRLCGESILGSYNWFLANRDAYAVCAIGNPRTRYFVVRELMGIGVKFATVIHPSVKMSKYVEIGEGSIVCAGSILTTQVKVGNHVHINLNSTIGHDVVIGDYSTIAPGVNVSGNVRVGPGCDLGTNSSVIQGLRIGSGATVGAGAVVNRDVEANTVAVGIPAKVIKTSVKFEMVD
ncbi:Bacterial transferase hexapeptide (six repeats) [Acididesulfobacillus acetoxydans]|uniref:Bacterial transferase hexapeptide (Six repeats) n=1 Tax=Acididesulfobacillus acetoxydans TaxID=1561005 RepID=A0A8S0Y4Q8_9FIRM|nr:acetyltransferase [Acididesulfobacillus acetoxydans]CAA7603155.1 Bacterial transferase hexapeptide (six repeats) [Acididesulfobacillus acetoxydans]CEJ07617.1 Sugar O-acyltransferase, sialic acid O-acetyltransferase NeuD [Acididesulfobacillus acetoxydans]